MVAIIIGTIIMFIVLTSPGWIGEWLTKVTGIKLFDRGGWWIAWVIIELIIPFLILYMMSCMFMEGDWLGIWGMLGVNL